MPEFPGRVCLFNPETPAKEILSLDFSLGVLDFHGRGDKPYSTGKHWSILAVDPKLSCFFSHIPLFGILGHRRVQLRVIPPDLKGMRQ